MLNGKCKVWREGDGSCHALMNIDTPRGKVQILRSARPEETDNPTELLRQKVEYVAGFFDTGDLVSPETLKKAQDIVSGYLDPSTRDMVGADIEEIQSRSLSDDDAYDLDYAIRRVSKDALRTSSESAYRRGVEDDQIGASALKKLARKVRRKTQKVLKKAGPAAYIALPPLAAVALVKKVAKTPAVKRAAIKAIARTGRTPAGTLVPKHIRALAAQAAQNIETAKVVAQQAQQTTTEQPYEAPYEEAPYETEEAYYDEYADEAVQGDDAVGLDLNRIRKVFKKAVKDVRRGADDITKDALKVSKSPVAQLLISNVPGIGPGVAAGLKLMEQARNGIKSATDKVSTVKSLAAKGVPSAEKALDNLKTADAMLKEAKKPEKESWWRRISPFGLYRKGAA